MLGKLSIDAIPLHEPIIMYTLAVVAVLGVVAVGALTYFKVWGYLWREWLTSVDHKRIGIMYIVVALIMIVRGWADAIMMRLQLVLAKGDALGYLPPDHYDQIFTAHGIIMIIFVATPLMVGMMNIAVPLQIGARDCAFPYLNSLSFWLFFAAMILINLSFAVGEFAKTGWVAYPPLSGKEYSPGVGVDYYLWSMQLSGLGTTLTAVNFVATIIKMRAPGMTLMKTPIFTWTCLASMIIVLAVFPPLTVAFCMLTLDRYLDFHFFTNELGGNPMMYVNLFWLWGHPEVYVLILPAFGMISEAVSIFTRKRLFGYSSMIYATVVICFLSLIVWAHHFFTMGSGAKVNAFFGIMTSVIAIPTGCKIFTWLMTLYKGKLRLNNMTWLVLGFLISFTGGGMTGVMLSIPAADFVLHNSQWLVAHFHHTIIGGAVLGYLVGLNLWFPKALGFRMNDAVGKLSTSLWIIGFYVAFMPLYIVGFKGMTRRVSHYDNPDWEIWMQIALVGALIIGVGLVLNVVQILWSTYKHKELKDNTGDPWDGRTLEWSISSPPPFYNFATIPHVNDIDPFFEAKQKGVELVPLKEKYDPIHMPKNTANTVIIGLLLTAMGFGLIWYIWWLATLSFVGVIVAFIIRTYDEDIDYYVQPEEIARIERAHHEAKAQALATA